MKLSIQASFVNGADTIELIRAGSNFLVADFKGCFLWAERLRHNNSWMWLGFHFQNRVDTVRYLRSGAGRNKPLADSKQAVLFWE